MIKKPDIETTPDSEWPIGMRPDGTLNSVTPPPGLADAELRDWLDTQDDVGDD